MIRRIATRLYERQVRRLLTVAEREAGEAEISSRPDAWPVIQGLGGARKARVARGGRGKSGGARVIYFFMPAPGVVALLMAYAKSDKEDLNEGDRKAIRAAIEGLREDLGDDTAGQADGGGD